MIICQDVASIRAERASLGPKATVGFVPTMGALHAGHASLASQSVAENDHTIVSIFVNPTQFGPNEDLARYPKTFEADKNLLESLGVDMIFAPGPDDIYPKGKDGAAFTFNIHGLADLLCGSSRPGHMQGVVQVVNALLNIVQPTNAYFGLKDYQQYRILKTMGEEFHHTSNIIGCPIVREEDGLAMSSRNLYLSDEERQQALALYHVLTDVKSRIEDFQTAQHVEAFVEESLARYPLVRLDYFNILNETNLQELETISSSSYPRAFMAAYLGKTRLIDNMSLYNHSSSQG
ncbi:MAG: pantoate--beta-alanine ligase [Bacteroidia bacterium]